MIKEQLKNQQCLIFYSYFLLRKECFSYLGSNFTSTIEAWFACSCTLKLDYFERMPVLLLLKNKTHWNLSQFYEPTEKRSTIKINVSVYFISSKLDCSINF